MSAQVGVVPNDSIEAYIASLENEFNGSILIAINGDVRYQKHVGYIDFKQSALISSASRFNIGSIAKEFPAMALLYCVEEGHVQLRAPIDQYLSELPEWASEIDCENWPQFFLKFIVSHPAVNCAIPATSQLVHLHENMGAGYGRLPDAAMREHMAKLFT